MVGGNVPFFYVEAQLCHYKRCLLLRNLQTGPRPPPTDRAMPWRGRIDKQTTVAILATVVTLATVDKLAIDTAGNPVNPDRCLPAVLCEQAHTRAEHAVYNILWNLGINASLSYAGSLSLRMQPRGGIPSKLRHASGRLKSIRLW